MQSLAVRIANQDPHIVSGVSAIVRGDEQRPIKPRRRHLQAVGTWQHVLDVQHGRQLSADASAVFNVYTALVVDDDAQHPATVLEEMSEVHQDAALAPRNALGVRAQ